MKLKNILSPFLLFLAIILSYSALNAQQKPVNGKPVVEDKKLVQLSGVVTAPDGRSAIPFSTVHISHTFRGTIAGMDGFYSMVVGEKDTVEFHALGFKKFYFVVPSGNQDQKLTKNISLETDTLTEEPTIITPYLTKEEFRQAFLSLKLKDDLTERAKKNLDQETLRDLYETLARDGQENQLLTLQQIASSSYYAGGQKNYAMLGNGIPIPTSLLNPFAWVEFLKAVKDGRYKNKKKTDKEKDKLKDNTNHYDY